MFKASKPADLEQQQDTDGFAIEHYRRRFGKLTQNEVFSGFIKLFAKLVNHAKISVTLS